jgi:hypothetical protein
LKIEDPRSWKNQDHDFTATIGTPFCAALAGIDSFSGISDFVEMHFTKLSKYFDLSGGIPSHDRVAWIEGYRESYSKSVEKRQRNDRNEILYIVVTAGWRETQQHFEKTLVYRKSTALAMDKKDRSIKSLMRRNAMSFTHLVNCLLQISHA